MKRTTKTLFNICPSCFLMLTELETWQNFSCMGIPLCFSAIIMKKGNFSDFCLLLSATNPSKKGVYSPKTCISRRKFFHDLPLIDKGGNMKMDQSLPLKSYPFILKRNGYTSQGHH